MLLDPNLYYFLVLTGGRKRFHEFITVLAMLTKPLKPKGLIYLQFLICGSYSRIRAQGHFISDYVFLKTKIMCVFNLTH